MYVNVLAPIFLKMRAIFVILSVLGLSLAAPKARDLTGDLQDFLDFLPLLKIQQTFTAHLQDDGALVEVVEYLKSDRWQSLVDKIAANPEVQNLADYLNKAGIPVGDILAYLNILIKRAQPGTEPNPDGSLQSFLDDIADDISTENLVGFVGGKLTVSEDFQKLYVKISSEDVHALVDEVLEMDEVLHLKVRLTEMGVAVDDILTLVYEFFGWGIPIHNPL